MTPDRRALLDALLTERFGAAPRPQIRDDGWTVEAVVHVTDELHGAARLRAATDDHDRKTA